MALFVPFLSTKMPLNNPHIKIIIMIVLVIVTYVIKPTDHYNKQVCDEDKLLFRKKAVILLSIYSLIMLLLFFLNMFIVSNLVLLTSCLCVLNNCLARLKMLKQV